MDSVFLYIFVLMNYKPLVIKGISPSQTQTGAYALILEEVQTGITLPIVIDYYGAQAISLGMEKEAARLLSRPLTHDLFRDYIDKTNYKLNFVLIHDIQDGVFFTNIYLVNQETGKEIILDARPSDAVALAVRYSSKILVTNSVLEEAGILLELNPSDIIEEHLKELFVEREETIEELKEQLEEAVRNEDFDLAVELQEKIKQRQENKD